jgi:hypothetical protein
MQNGTHNITRRRQVMHELLGEPTLLYRHAPSYTLMHDCTRQASSEKDFMRWRSSLLEESRNKARFYDTGLWFSDYYNTAKRPRLADKDSGGGAASVKEDAALLLETRKSMFPDTLVCHTLDAFGQPYCDKDDLSRIKWSMYTNEIHDTVKDLIREREHASPEYLAPFCSAALAWGLSEEKVPEKGKVLKVVGPPSDQATPNLHYGPVEHGNCLVSFWCPCCQSTPCLVHPTGEMLSKVCVSNIQLPVEDKTRNPCRCNPQKTGEFDVGERILQIAECSPMGEGEKSGYFVVRSSSYTTLICVKLRGKYCKFDIALVKRIDLRSMTNQPENFRPIHVAAHPRYGNSFANPLLAIVSQNSTVANVVHCGVEDVARHAIHNLQKVELAEFSASNPMVLHAAATSYIRPAMAKHVMHRRPMLGHGSSLYTIDLRSNKATFQWSPSAEDFVTEGFHSVSGIIADWDNAHKLFVSSTSAGKLWELDSRMPYKVVNSWGLPGLCHNMGINMSSGDLHGEGTLLHLPRYQDYSDDDVIRPIYSVDKSLGTFGFSMYQQPLTRPLLGTDSLEIVSGVMEGTARSAVFPLPDISRSVFTCGITSIRSKISSFLKSEQCSELGYSQYPEIAQSVVTMTSNGDLYCHTLLECSDGEKPRGVQLESGTTGVRVESLISDDKRTTTWDRYRYGGFNFRVRLDDTPITPSSKFTPINAASRGDCEPFVAVSFIEVSKQQSEVLNAVKSSKEETAKLSKQMRSQVSLQLLDGFKGKEINTSTPAVRDSGQKDLVVMGDKLWRAPPVVRFEPSISDEDSGEES